MFPIPPYLQPLLNLPTMFNDQLSEANATLFTNLVEMIKRSLADV